MTLSPRTGQLSGVRWRRGMGLCLLGDLRLVSKVGSFGDLHWNGELALELTAELDGYRGGVPYRCFGELYRCLLRSGVR